MKVASGDYLEIAIWWGRDVTFDSERFKSIKGNFSDGGNQLSFGCLLAFSPILRVLHKGSGEGGTVHTSWVQQFFEIFGKKGDTWHMVLGYNPAGNCFVLRDLVLIMFFQISHNCVTEWMTQAKFLLKPV